MKTQIIFIHGGNTYDTYEDYVLHLKNYMIESLDYFKGKNWGNALPEMLSDDFEVILPRMPNNMNAKYSEWRIYFEKIIPFLDSEIILVGNSLGSIFFTKYLSENILPKKIKGIFLVGAPFDASGTEHTLGDFILPENLDKLEQQSKKINFYYSKDDLVVPFANMEKYKEKLPNATYTVFEDRGHFRQEEFPEIVKDIKNLF